jgi:hypothetical protein
MDLDSGYWQVACEPSSKSKLAFFTPSGKKRFTTMPMGATNAHPVFVALVAKFKKEWDLKAKNVGLQGFYSQVIVDDIIICARNNETLIAYFRCILEVLQHYRCTAKLKKCRFLPSVAEFVGLDIHPQGNSPAKSKFEAFKKLGPPNTFTDLNMLIGCMKSGSRGGEQFRNYAPLPAHQEEMRRQSWKVPGERRTTTCWKS